MKKRDKVENMIATLDIVYDCLIAMDKVHDEHTDVYNGVISVLINYAREQIESAKQDNKRG